MLRKGITNRMRKSDKVEFEQHSWVDVPDPFDLKVFTQRLFLNFHSDDIRASEMREGWKDMRVEGLIECCCCEFLFEKEDYLVVCNGLRSKDDWELIKSKFLSSKAEAKGCILIIPNEETVATHYVKDKKYQAFNVKDLEADTSIFTLINKVITVVCVNGPSACTFIIILFSWYYGIRGMKGRLFYDRRKDKLEWTNEFKIVGGNNPYEGKDEEKFGVFMVGEDGDDMAVINPLLLWCISTN